MNIHQSQGWRKGTQNDCLRTANVNSFVNCVIEIIVFNILSRFSSYLISMSHYNMFLFMIFRFQRCLKMKRSYIVFSETIEITKMTYDPLRLLFLRKKHTRKNSVWCGVFDLVMRAYTMSVYKEFQKMKILTSKKNALRQPIANLLPSNGRLRPRLTEVNRSKLAPSVSWNSVLWRNQERLLHCNKFLRDLISFLLRYLSFPQK